MLKRLINNVTEFKILLRSIPATVVTLFAVSITVSVTVIAVPECTYID